MSQRKPTCSSSSDDGRYALMDEKKRKRMISNRESARRSRKKREQHVTDLNDQILYYSNKNNEMVLKINEVKQRYVPVESENVILRAQREELRKRLESLEIITSYLNDPDEYAAVNAPQDPWLKPWEPPVQFQPIMTSACAGDLHF